MKTIIEIDRLNTEQNELTGKMKGILQHTRDVSLVDDSLIKDIIHSTITDPVKIIQKLLDLTWSTDPEYDGLQGRAFYVMGLSISVVFASISPSGNRMVNVNTTGIWDEDDTEHMGYDGDMDAYLSMSGVYKIDVKKVVELNLSDEESPHIDELTLKPLDTHVPVKRFHNLDTLIKVSTIQNYHTILLEDFYPFQLTQTYDGVKYSLSNENGYGGVICEPENLNVNNMLKFDHWLIDTFDPDHKLLTRSMNTQLSENLEAVDLDIVDHVNNVTSLYIWLIQHLSESKTLIDFSDCPVLPVRQAFTTLGDIDLDKLKGRLTRTDNTLNLYRSDRLSEVNCTLSDSGDVTIACSRTGFELSPTQNCYGVGIADNPRTAMVGKYLNIHGRSQPMSMLSFYEIDLLLYLCASITSLSTKTYIKHHG